MERKVCCPICNKPLMTVESGIYINFDMRTATQKVFCTNCKRKIKYSEVKKETQIGNKD